MENNVKVKQISKKSRMEKFINWVEVVGNKLPDPVTISFILAGIVLVVSCIMANTGVTVVHPGTKKTISVVNLLSVDGMRNILSSMVKNLQNFPPLGFVLVMTLGTGVAEKSGYMKTLLKCSVNRVSPKLVTAVIMFVGIMANAAGDAGQVVLPPLAATIFLGLGRNPLVGIFAAYAAVAGGFCANLIVNMSDVVAVSFTIPAAKMIDPNYSASPAINLYYNIASTIVLFIVGTIVTEKIVVPHLGKYVSKDAEALMDAEVTEVERKALKKANISILIYVIALIALCIGKNAFLADPKTGSLLSLNSALMQGIVPIITLLFFIPGLVYGKAVGNIKNDKDVVAMAGNAIKELGPYIVLAFAAAQFIQFFSTSNIGMIIAVKGAEWLKSSGFSGIGVIIGFIVIGGFINLFVGSASAKWAIMAPIFVPMLMMLGYDPAVTQMAYRIGDTITNTIGPLSPFFPVLIGYIRKYDKDAGIGTLIANMLPYTIYFAIAWILLLVIFIVFKIPVGPGGPIYFTAH